MTRADVARYAGVSSAVVSYVVNNGPKRVAPATESRVREAVELLGYQPNLSARALRSGTTHMLGLVLTDWLNPYFAELAQAIELAATARGHAVVMTHSNSDAQVEAQRVAELSGRQVDGLLISSMLTDDELAAAAVSRRGSTLPTVLLNRPGPVAGFSSVGPDFRGGARAMVEHLIGYGHRRIALATGSLETSPLEPREAGWLAALHAAGLRPGPVGRGGYTRESGYAMGRQMLTMKRPPTAIFAVSDLTGVGILRAAHELGLRVPEDVAVVSFDGTSESEFSWPSLTSVRQPLQEMASAAVSRVLDTLPHDDHQLFDTTLIIRRSCGCGGAPGPR